MTVIEEILKEIENIDDSLLKKAQDHLDALTKPQGSLGRLEELAVKVVAITGKTNPSAKNKTIITAAADHGVAKENVSAFPQEVTPQMVYNFLKGGAGINVLAKHAGAKVVVVDAGVASDLLAYPNLIVQKVALGTKNIAEGPAMSRQEAERSIEIGINIVKSEYDKGVDIIGTGDMGIANTTASSAIVAVITGVPVETVTGCGTGIDNKMLAHKINIIKKALAINKPDPEDALDVLSKVGGFEIGALTGVILACASLKIPVVIDGFISGAAALIAYKIEPKVKEYMIASHCSVEQGHKVTLDYIGLKPLLDLDLRLGEGTGAALAIPIVEAAVKIYNEMATFEGAEVSNRKS